MCFLTDGAFYFFWITINSMLCSRISDLIFGDKCQHVSQVIWGGFGIISMYLYSCLGTNINDRLASVNGPNARCPWPISLSTHCLSSLTHFVNARNSKTSVTVKILLVSGLLGVLCLLQFRGLINKV